MSGKPAQASGSGSLTEAPSPVEAPASAPLPTALFRAPQRGVQLPMPPMGEMPEEFRLDLDEWESSMRP